jgi:hypothetical protein
MAPQGSCVVSLTYEYIVVDGWHLLDDAWYELYGVTIMMSCFLHKDGHHVDFIEFAMILII